MRPRSVGIAGTGLIGASIGLRARSLGRTAIGWDVDPARAGEALEAGAIERVARSFEELAASVDVLVLAAPLDATLELIGLVHATPVLPRLILDVASLKAPVIERARGLEVFAATHPIAGSERSGPRAASASLFEGAAWAYVPGRRDAEARAFIEAMGARPVPVEAEAHDRALALTSHLPQLIATALAGQLGARLDDPNVRDLCGPGAASSVRLGGSPWSMWSSLLRGAPGRSAAQELRSLGEVLSRLAAELESGDTSALQARFAAANAAAALIRANAAQRTRVSEPEARTGSTERPDPRPDPEEEN